MNRKLSVISLLSILHIGNLLWASQENKANTFFQNLVLPQDTLVIKGLIQTNNNPNLSLLVSADRLIHESVLVALTNNADIETRDGQGKTALIITIGAIAEYPWLKKGTEKQEQIITTLLQHGANHNARDNHGKNALDYAESEALKGFTSETVIQLLRTHHH